MTLFKKAVSVLLCLLMCLSLFPAAAFAAEPAAEGTEAALLDGVAEAENPEEPEQAALEEIPEDTPAAEAGNDPEDPAPAEEEALLPETAEESEEEAAPAEEAGTDPEEAAGDEPEEEAEDEPEEEAEDEEIEIYVESSPITYAPGASENDGSLLDEYAYKQLYSLRPQGMTINAVHDSGLRLEGVNRTVFYNLKNQIASVAAGDCTSTALEIPVEELNLGQTAWTAADLGLESLTVVGPDGKRTYSDEAMDAVNEKVGFELQKVITALLSDCPYELYWYDKTIGTVLKSYSFTGTAARIEIVGNMTFYFNVIGVYCDNTTITINGQVVRCGINPDTGTAVSAAVSNAQNIVASYAGRSDYDKLLGFKNAICSMVSYNNDALIEGVDYGDPWQIIYVFDGRENTNVVCEGYAKAFQYLCDIGDLSGRMMTYAVSGVMRGGTGAGNHMWNIVRMENGKNYIVDVTNCDEGTIGAPDKLFLAGVDSGSVEEGYDVVVGDSTIHYEYESKVRDNFSTAELSISENSYLVDIGQHSEDEVWNQAQLIAALEEISESGGEGALNYPGDGDFYIDQDITIPAGVSFSLRKGTLFVKSGATLTINKGKVYTLHARIDGTLSIVGGELHMWTLGSELQVSGTVDNRGNVISYNPRFVRTENMLASTTAKYNVMHDIAADADLVEACGYAAATVGDSAVVHNFVLSGFVTVTTSVTIPANASMRIPAGTGMTISKGTLLTNNGSIQVLKSLVLPGILVNNGDIKLGQNITVNFGDYAGTGTLGVYNRDGSRPWGKLTGVSEDMFELVLGYPSGFYGLRLLDPVGTDPMMVTAQVASLTLDGTIGINFLVTMSASVLADENACAVFVYKDVEYPRSVQGVEPDSRGYYTFTFYIPAAEFANTVSLKFMAGEDVIPFLFNGTRLNNDTMKYSGQRYSKALPADNPARPLIDMLHNYCYNAYLGLEKQEPDVLPNSIATNPDISTVVATDMKPYRNTLTGSVTGLTVNAISLNLESTTEINLRFTPDEGRNIDEFRFEVNGSVVTPEAVGTSYMLTIQNIAAKDLDTMYTVTVSCGDETMEIQTSALAYCYTVLKKALLTTEMQDVCKALYLYNQAANAYFNN